MKPFLWHLASFTFCLLFGATQASAQEQPLEPIQALPQPQAAPQPREPLQARAETSVKFAVVIGNNHSLQSARPDLHYADDDAARYFSILQGIAPERVALLASFDRDTARLFPDLHAKTSLPTLAELRRAGDALAVQVNQVVRAGQRAELYFVFAGHGDVAEGMGFIELQDARFTAQDLETWLKRVPFTQAHVILDSCNSFFMLGVRKPGGRRFATGEDAVRSLATRLPNVGVFLSTSAEGEAFEWSEIQSGIFSHVVRSGLLGAADANGNGDVSYLELAAFVDTATQGVSNPNMRPNVFARGPGGSDDKAIVNLNDARGARRFELTDNQPLRLRIRDKDGLPLLDANAEAATRLALALPGAWTTGAVLERASAAHPEALALYALPEAPAVVQLASLQPITSRGESRGPAEVFAHLFAAPFGPKAVSAYTAARKSQPAPVFGVSRADAMRMELVLGQIASAERNQRILGGLALLGSGAVVAGAGASYLYYGDRLSDLSKNEAYAAGGVYTGLGALYLLGGAYLLASPSSGEDAERDFRAELAKGGDYSQAFVVADKELQELEASESRARWLRAVMGGGFFALGSSAVIAEELSNTSPDERVATRVIGGSMALFGGVILGASLLTETPAERLTKIWRDPNFVSVQPSVTVDDKGAFFSLTGTF